MFKVLVILLTVLFLHGMKCVPLDKLQHIEQNPKGVEIVSRENKVTDKSYEFSYVQSDGQTRYEKGILTNVNGADVYEVTGSYGFKGTDGKYYFVKYSSGVSGFRATVKAFEDVSSLIDDRFSIDSLQIDEKLLMTLIG